MFILLEGMVFLSFATVFLNSCRKSLAENETWLAKDLELVANGVSPAKKEGK